VRVADLNAVRSVFPSVDRDRNGTREFTLDPGAHVTLHNGNGTDSATDLYWGSGSPIWNNAGDTVFVYDDEGTLVLEGEYN